MTILDKPIWQVRKEDRSTFPFTSPHDALMFATTNTTYEHMCTLIMPNGEEYAMLQRQVGANR